MSVDIYLFYLVDTVGIGLVHRTSEIVAFICIHQSSIFLPNLTVWQFSVVISWLPYELTPNTISGNGSDHFCHVPCFERWRKTLFFKYLATGSYHDQIDLPEAIIQVHKRWLLTSISQQPASVKCASDFQPVMNVTSQLPLYTGWM